MFLGFFLNEVHLRGHLTHCVQWKCTLEGTMSSFIQFISTFSPLSCAGASSLAPLSVYKLSCQLGLLQDT